jgi:hypothetical protein
MVNNAARNITAACPLSCQLELQLGSIIIAWCSQERLAQVLAGCLLVLLGRPCCSPL